jgi:hypothetical protein
VRAVEGALANLFTLRTARFTESFQGLWLKAATLQLGMEQAVKVFTAARFPMSLLDLNFDMTVLDCCQWQMLDRTLMEVNFLFSSLRLII